MKSTAKTEPVSTVVVGFSTLQNLRCSVTGCTSGIKEFNQHQIYLPLSEVQNDNKLMQAIAQPRLFHDNKLKLLI